MFQNGNDLTLLVIIGIAGMLILSLGFLAAIFYSQRKKSQHQLEVQQLREEQQNRLIEAAVRSEESERHRIAEELHDEVGALLSSTRLHFGAIDTEHLAERDVPVHHRAKELLDESIQKVRAISHNLHSNVLKELGFNEALDHFIEKLTRDAGIKVDVDLDETYKTVNPDGDISLYRMLQEILNNLLKHGRPKLIYITSKNEPEALVLKLYHDGEGLTQEQFEELRYKKDGLGLKNIQNRIILLKGSIRFMRLADGFQVIIQIPKYA